MAVLTQDEAAELQALTDTLLADPNRTSFEATDFQYLAGGKNDEGILANCASALCDLDLGKTGTDCEGTAYERYTETGDYGYLCGSEIWELPPPYIPPVPLDGAVVYVLTAIMVLALVGIVCSR